MQVQDGLRTQYLAAVAREVISMDINFESRTYALSLTGAPPDVGPVYYPHVLVRGMPSLTSLRLTSHGSVDTRAVMAILRAAKALPRLASLKLFYPPAEADFRWLCESLALTFLDLGSGDLAAERAQLLLANVGKGRMAGLQSLAAPLPAAAVQHVSLLSPLTALTSLHVRVPDRVGSANLSGVASLTALSSLTVQARTLYCTLSPLTSLTRLTLLEFKRWSNHSVEDRDHWGISVISHLTELRVLRCSFHYMECQQGLSEDPLPPQLRFLRTATALEELDLRFFNVEYFCVKTVDATREAVASLSELKRVTITAVDVRTYYCSPLRAFAAAPTTEALTYVAGGGWKHLWGVGWCEDLDVPGFQTVEGAGLLYAKVFKALPKLRSLFLSGLDYHGKVVLGKPVPHTIDEDILEILPLLQLTSLCLSLEVFSDRHAHPIRQIRDLQELVLCIERCVPHALDPLLKLKGLTRLELHVIEPLDSNSQGTWSRLEAKVLEQARSVGLRAEVHCSLLPKLEYC